MTLLGRKATFDNGTDFVSIKPLFRATNNAKIFTKVATRISISSDSGVSITTFIITVRLPSIINFITFRADEFKTKTSIFTFTGAIRDKSFGWVFRATRGMVRIKWDWRVIGWCITVI